jgi:tetratricopeptide (TPR) repeat protein
MKNKIILLLVYIFLISTQLLFSQNTNDYQEIIQKGIELMQDGKYDEAIINFQNTLEFSDYKEQKAFSYYCLANIYCYAKLDYKTSLGYAEHAINLIENNNTLLNDVYLIIIDIYLVKKDFSQAMDYANKSIALSPENEWNYISRANILQLNKNYNDAIKDCNKAININSKNSAIYGLLGVIYQKQNLLNKAFEEYKKGIELSPGYYGNYNNIAFIYFDQKKYNEAKTNFEKSLNINNQYKDSYAGLAITYLRLGNVELALSNYKKAIELDKNYDGNIKAIIDEGMFYSDVELKAFDELLAKMKNKK